MEDGESRSAMSFCYSPSSIFHPPSPWRYRRRMDIYDHPTFRMACQQFDLVADHLQIPAERPTA